jgi:asparagine N-glycosylation enzyme membrane subunit Stt3
MQVATAGFVLLLPALSLVSAGLADSDIRLAPALVHPVVVMGGLALAFLINAWSVMRVGVRKDDGTVVGTIAVRLRGSMMNLAAIGLSGLLVAIIAAYLFVENFQARPS